MTYRQTATHSDKRNNFQLELDQLHARINEQAQQILTQAQRLERYGSAGTPRSENSDNIGELKK